MIKNIVNIGMMFGSWEVINIDCVEKRNVLCLCKKCGSHKEVSKSNLILQKSTQCNACSLKTHGLSKTRLYKIWENIKQRTRNINHDSFYLYGARGIKICDLWSNNFQSFYDWSMKNGYKDNLVIDRIDNEGHYSPTNCRWITNKKNQNNKRKSVFLTYKGKTQTLSEWAEELNINRNTLSNRIKRSKWSVEKSFETPINSKEVKNYGLDNQTKRIA